MFESKPLASLTSALLARKGDARPAMRRTFVPMSTVAALPVSIQKDDDLGWNDHGEDVPETPVVQLQERIARSFPAPVPKAPVAPAARERKAAFTLRLDSDRHLRLRLASAIAKRSAQQLVTEALDAFLDQQPGLDALVAQARKTAPK
jgi:hypothetical protein